MILIGIQRQQNMDILNDAFQKDLHILIERVAQFVTSFS